MKHRAGWLAVASSGLIACALAGAISIPASAGSVTTPTVTAPTVTGPSVTTPSVTAPSVTTPTVKTPTVPTTSTCAGQLKVVKNLWKKAPAGVGRDTAKTHYDNAVAANKNHDDKTCLSELDAASAALK